MRADIRSSITGLSGSAAAARLSRASSSSLISASERVALRRAASHSLDSLGIAFDY
jgi:hypothetical protein